MDAAKKQDLLNKQAEKYKTKEAAKKRPVKQTSRKIQNYGCSKERRITSETETKILW